MSALKRATLRPISCAYLSSDARSSACWLANSLSCIAQNLPWALAAIAASAASRAWSWKGSGWLRKATRTSLPYLSSICLRVGPTLEQKGHWKSENSKTVTLAYLGPFIGVQAASSIFCGAEGGGCCACAPCGFFTASMIWSNVFPCRARSATCTATSGARGQLGSSFLHFAVEPCGQPQSHGRSLSTLSAT